jgi:FtsH-binding integral membrane protein
MHIRQPERLVWEGRTKVRRLLIALCLGIISFFLSIFLGESIPPFAALILVAAYFLICQFLLSRGRVDAYRKDWPIMLALDATVFVSVIIIALVEKREVFLSQGLGLLFSGCGGTYAGAVMASLTARRKAA